MITAARAAINGLMAEVLEEHVREYLLPRDSEACSRESDAAEELIEIIHSYFTWGVRVTACGLQNAIQATKMGCSIEALSNWRLRSRSTQNAVVADHTTAGNCSNRGSPPCTLVFINGWQMSSGQIAVLQAAGGVLSIPPDLLRDNCPISDSVKGYQTPALGTRRTVRAGQASDNP